MAARAEPGHWRREIVDNPPNRHCARRPSSRPLLEEEGPLFPAPLPRRRGFPGATRIGGKKRALSSVRARKEALPARRRMAEISPSTPLEVATAESTASEIGRPFPRLRPWKRAARRGADLPRSPHRPTEIAGTPRHLTGPFRMDRVANDDFISPSYTHQGEGASDSWRWCEK